MKALSRRHESFPHAALLFRSFTDFMASEAPTMEWLALLFDSSGFMPRPT
jgi:hypothetical protein